MQKILNRLPQIGERGYLLISLACVFLLSAMMKGVSFVLLTFFVLPWCIGMFYSTVKHCKIRFNRYNVLLLASAAIMAVSTILNRDLSAQTLCTLALLGAFMLVAGIIPEGSNENLLRKEVNNTGMAVICCMLPFIFLGVLSVFMGRPLYFLWEKSRIGIQRVGSIEGRIYVFCHPNTTARGALIGIIFAIYGLMKSKRKWIHVGLIAAIIVFVLAIVHAQSRTCNIALGVMVGAIVFRFVYLRFHNKYLGIVIGLAAAAAAFLLALELLGLIFTMDVRIASAFLSDPGMVSDGVSRAVSEGEFDVFSNGRDYIWKNGLKYMMDHPSTFVFGMGIGEIMPRITEAIPEMKAFNHLHNGLLEALVRGGVPMLFCALWMLLLMVKPCLCMFVAQENDSNRGNFMLPVFIGVMLVVSLTENVLFANVRLATMLFYFVAGHIMRDYYAKTGIL